MAAVGLTGCVPEPTPGTIDIVGDSLAVQASWKRSAEFPVGAPPGSDVLIDAHPGIGFADVLAAERARAAKGRPATLVIALGANDAGPVDGGWEPTDDKQLRDLMGAPSPSACVVLVLPGYSDKPAVTASYRVDLRVARSAMRAAAADRSKRGQPTVVADWGAVALAHPELTGTDGIHLAATAPEPGRAADEAAATAWTKVVWGGVARCPKP